MDFFEAVAKLRAEEAKAIRMKSWGNPRLFVEIKDGELRAFDEGTDRDYPIILHPDLAMNLQEITSNEWECYQ